MVFSVRFLSGCLIFPTIHTDFVVVIIHWSKTTWDVLYVYRGEAIIRLACILAHAVKEEHCVTGYRHTLCPVIDLSSHGMGSGGTVTHVCGFRAAQKDNSKPLKDFYTRNDFKIATQCVFDFLLSS